MKTVWRQIGKNHSYFVLDHKKRQVKKAKVKKLFFIGLCCYFIVSTKNTYTYIHTTNNNGTVQLSKCGKCKYINLLLDKNMYQ